MEFSMISSLPSRNIQQNKKNWKDFERKDEKSLFFIWEKNWKKKFGKYLGKKFGKNLKNKFGKKLKNKCNLDVLIATITNLSQTELRLVNIQGL